MPKTSEWGASVIKAVANSTVAPEDNFYEDETTGEKVYPFRKGGGSKQAAPTQVESPSLSTPTQQALGFSDDQPVPVDVKAPVQDIAPGDPELDARARKAEDASFTEAFGASFRVDNTGYALYRNYVDPRFNYDPEFDGVGALTDEAYQERIAALTLADKESLYEELAGTYNRDHFEYRLADFEKKQADETLIMDAGGKGLLARLGANVLDITDIAVMVAAPGLGAASKAGKLGRMLTRAASAGSANAAVEGVIAHDNPFRDGTDVAFAAAAGMVMGGSLSFLSRGENLKMQKTANDHAESILDKATPAKSKVPAAESPTVQARHAEIDTLPRKALKAQMAERGLECKK